MGGHHASCHGICHKVCHNIQQAGIEKLQNLHVLYASNNRIRDWAEVERLAQLPRLEDLLLLNNPLCNEYADNMRQYRIEVVRRLPQLTKLDGQPVSMEEREAAKGGEAS